MFKAGHTSLFPLLAESCKKHQTRQTQFTSQILLILGYDQSGSDNSMNENFIQRLARFGQDVELKKDDGSPLYMTDFAGTVTLQHMMEFHKPLKVFIFYYKNGFLNSDL
jgi:hypothetical protein